MNVRIIYEEFNRHYLANVGLGKKFSKWRFVYAVYDNKICYTTDGYKLIIIPLSTFPYNYKELGTENDRLIQDFIKPVASYDVVAEYKYSRPMATDMRIARIEATDSSERFAYVNEKFLKMFNSDAEFKLAAFSPETKPVGVYEYGQLVGIICPVKVPK